MKILFSNDDGYQAIGIQTLYKEFAPHYESYMCAPMFHKSAFSHAINYYDYLKVTPLIDSVKGYAVDSTPADSVRAALLGLFDVEFDLVLSGINYGINAAQDVYYSGTVGAAREAVLLNKFAIAASIDLEGHNKEHVVNTDIEECFQYAAHIMRKIVEMLPKSILDYRGSLININFPFGSKAKGIKISNLGFHQYHTILSPKTQDNEQYIKIDTIGRTTATGQGTDVYYLDQGYITVTGLYRGVVVDEKLQQLISCLENITV